jgi:hypothetical protein
MNETPSAPSRTQSRYGRLILDLKDWYVRRGTSTGHDLWRRARTTPPAVRDDSAIGTIFIDVLFAAVVARALQIGTAEGGFPLAGQAQLFVAAIVTIASWVGYHNSANRTRYRIAFFNLPLMQFTVEIGHVFLYWLLVTTSEAWRIQSAPHSNAAGIPEAIIMASIFVSYCLWDQISLAIRRSSKYVDFLMKDDQPSRRRVTFGAATGVVLISSAVILVRPVGAIVYVIDGVFVLLVLGHRWLQNIVVVIDNKDSGVEGLPIVPADGED